LAPNFENVCGHVADVGSSSITVWIQNQKQKKRKVKVLEMVIIEFNKPFGESTSVTEFREGPGRRTTPRVCPKVAACMHKKARDKITAIGIQQAQKSNMKKRHGAVITNGGSTILATGFNHRLSHLRNKYSIHAEESAVRNMRNTCKNMPRNTMLHLFVVRVLDNGALANSAPCAKYRLCIDNVRMISSSKKF